MDACTVYLNTFRYVMNADPTVKSSWSDIFKYLPALRRMFSCSVCGNILRNPHGAANGVCLHHVCYKCLGGKMTLKPSCSWCKDHSCFKENKKLRVLILSFKRLCAYISHSRLGTVIITSSQNGHDSEVENTQQALKDAEQFVDDYELTPPPVEPLAVLKQRVKEHKYSFSEYKPTASTSGFVRKQNAFSSQQLPSQTQIQSCSKQKKRGRKKSMPALALSPPRKSNASIHVKRLKRKALSNSRSRRKGVISPSNSKSVTLTLNKNAGNSSSRPRKRVSITPGNLLISQRPHRQLSGKFSVGQLWRETFLEEHCPEPEIYPDSGIDVEVGNSSDQDPGSLSPNSETTLLTKDEKASSNLTSSTAAANSEKMSYPLRDTRLHPITFESHQDNVTTSTAISASSTLGNAGSSEVKDSSNLKPNLTLKIPKKRFKGIPVKRGPRGTYLKKIVEEEVTSSVLTKRVDNLNHNQENSENSYSGPGARTRVKESLKQKKDVCRCARFKRPNQLTCFGQKCPCYRDKKPCVNCLCNGCKNPRRHSSEGAPPLMHMSKTAKDSHSQCLSPDLDLSMPRLSPIPRM